MGDADPHGAGFSLELGDNLVEMRDWLHEFAASVIRPAAAEWDNGGNPVAGPQGGVQDRAVLAGFLRAAVSGGVRARRPGRVRGAVLGRRGDRARAGRQLAGRDRGGGQRDARADRGVVPADVRRSGRGENGRVLLLRIRGGQRRQRDQDPATYYAARDEWVLNGVKTWVTNGGIADVHVVVASVDSALGSRGQASFIVPPGTPGLSMGQSSASTASGPRTPPRSCCPTSGCPAGA